MKKCLVIGSTVCDVMVYVDNLPVSQGDVHIRQQLMAVGGCAYNVTNILHHLNVPYTFISPVGTGIYGQFVAGELSKSGIVTDVRVQGENGCCYCFVEEHGERTFMSHHGVEYSFDPKWLEGLDLEGYDYIYICGLEIEESDGLKLIAALQNVSGQIIFCPGPRGTLIAQERLDAVYELSPIVHCNDDEIQQLTGKSDVYEAASVMFDMTHAPVVVTLGRNGAFLYDGDFIEVKGYESTVKDTIGAGDSHAGGVMAGLANGMSLIDAVNFGNQVASRVVEVSGVALGKEVFDELKCEIE